MTATIHHRSLGVFPADKPPLTLQAHRACREFFDKVDIDRLRKLAKNLSPSEWKKDFDHRNNALLEIYEKGLLGDALRFKSHLEKQRLAYYAYRIKRAAYLSATEVEKPEHLPFLVLIDRLALRAALCGGIALFTAGMFQSSLGTSNTAHILAATSVSLSELAIDSVPLVTPVGTVEKGLVGPKRVNFGALSGRNFGYWNNVPEGADPNLNSLLTGVEGIAPTTKTVNYCRQLELAWNAKSGRRGGVSGATKNTSDYTVSQYCSGTRTHMSFDDYLVGVQNRIKDARAHINFGKLCASKNLSDTECLLVQKMESVITAEYIGSYGMTELTPSMDAGHNFRILNHLMLNAGVEYVMSFPALYDKLGSRGLFQFTYMGHSNSPEHKRQGGAVILPFVPKTHKVPESVMGEMGLKTFDHDRAAHFFMLNNAADLVATLNIDQKDALWSVLNDESRRAEVLEFYATSHHAQGSVRGYARKWLGAGAKKPFHHYLKERFVKYGTKSLGGYRFLITRRGGVS